MKFQQNCHEFYPVYLVDLRLSLNWFMWLQPHKWLIFNWIEMYEFYICSSALCQHLRSTLDLAMSVGNQSPTATFLTLLVVDLIIHLATQLHMSLLVFIVFIVFIAQPVFSVSTQLDIYEIDCRILQSEVWTVEFDSSSRQGQRRKFGDAISCAEH